MAYRVGISGLGRGVGPARIFALMPDCTVVAGCDPDPAARPSPAEAAAEIELLVDALPRRLAMGRFRVRVR